MRGRGRRGGAEGGEERGGGGGEESAGPTGTRGREEDPEEE